VRHDRAGRGRNRDFHHEIIALVRQIGTPQIT
jgi:hypothetical protein